MRIFLTLFVLSVAFLGATGSEGPKSFPDYEAYGELLEQYVTPAGVQYSDWMANSKDRARLDLVLKYFSQVDRSRLSREGSIAFLINVYNAAMIDAVLENYPLDSVRSIGFLPFSVFRQDRISLEGESVSLDAVEKKLLLKEYGDPRIHFAVNCASVSCPPLRAEPFVGEKLEEQFDEQATLFANSSHAARMLEDEDVTLYSELFKWYDEDFPGDDPAVYLNRFRESPLPVGNRVGWIDYDWSLNEAEGQTE